MSLPSFPDPDKIPTREQAVNLLISSIAMEELSLSHIINAEGEKLQYALGTILGVTGPEYPLTIKDLLSLSDSVHKTLNNTMLNQFFMKEKIISALESSVIQSPTGQQGIGTIITGTAESKEQLDTEHTNGTAAYLVKEKWHSGGSLMRASGSIGSETTSYAIIPFASAEAIYTYTNNGEPSRVSLLGFGYGDRRDYGLAWASDYSIEIDPVNHKFSLNGNSNKQLAFSLPFNMTLRSIYITVGNYGQFDPYGKVFPYVQLFKAEQGTNSFEPIGSAIAIPDEPIGPGFDIPADTMRYAFNDKLEVKLPAGTRIAIGAMMRIADDTTGVKRYWFYFTGGIGMAYDSNPN